MGKKNKRKETMKKKSSKDPNLWTEAERDAYFEDLYGFSFIAGYTEGGIPYGIMEDEALDDLKMDEDDDINWSEEESEEEKVAYRLNLEKVSEDDCPF